MTSHRPKQAKLRNAEYYDMQSVLDQLYAQSEGGKYFTNLVHLILKPENVEMAYRNLKKNSGSNTAGVDGKTINDLAKYTPKQVVDYVTRRLRYYKPHRVKRVEISKRNGKKRPLGIPTIYDRLIQQCILQILEPICEARFYQHSYGFRPNRSCENAIARAYKLAQNHKLRHVVDMDISGFFDNVNHGKLLKQLWHIGIRDKKLLCIISQMLKAEIEGIGIPTKGTPQGGILSPLLANVVLNELDWWIASQWELFPTDHEYSSQVTRYGKAGINNGNRFAAQRKTGLKECYIVRYADDFKIFCRTRDEATRIYHATEKWLGERLFLKISEEKSKIVNLRKEYSEFLGICFKLVKKGKENRGAPKYVIQSHICPAAVSKIKDRMKENVKLLAHCKDNREQHVVIDNTNLYIVGVHNYYRIATHVVHDLNPINRTTLSKLDKGRKHRSLQTKEGKFLLPKYIQAKYSKSRCLRYINGRALIPISYVQTKTPLHPPNEVNKYTVEGRAALHKNLETVNIDILHYLMSNPNPNRSIEYHDNRLALYCAQNGKCTITKRILGIEDIRCHHIIPIHLGGSDKYQNLIIVSEDIHLLIHAKTENTIASLMGKLALNRQQLQRLNKYRELAGNDAICLKAA